MILPEIRFGFCRSIALSIESAQIFPTRPPVKSQLAMCLEIFQNTGYHRIQIRRIDKRSGLVSHRDDQISKSCFDRFWSHNLSSVHYDQKQAAYRQNFVQAELRTGEIKEFFLARTKGDCPFFGKCRNIDSISSIGPAILSQFRYRARARCLDSAMHFPGTSRTKLSNAIRRAHDCRDSNRIPD